MNELNACKHQTSEIFKQSFSFFRPQKSEKNNKKALFTAYYSPIIEANYKKSEQYPHAIYARPEDERLRFDSQRVGIDLDGALEGHGLELFYANNLYELYILHIEGGGKVVVKNSEKNYYLSFDGTNKQRWNFLSQYMIEQGYIKSHDMREQKLFLDAHPEKWREIYSLCPSYVYFKLTDTPPEGLDGIPLTDHRSMAQDRSIYSQKGLIGLVESKRPIQRPDGSITYIPFKRIYIDQDTGGAIKGEARADLYFGENEKAKIAGQNMKQEGAMTFLLSLPQE
jgi:membrane-bound lytic murein transglycosylase A